MNNSIDFTGQKQDVSPISEIVTVRSSYYYRWSTPGQVKERKFINGEYVTEKKKIVDAELKKLEEAVPTYRGYCPSCHKEIQVEYVGLGGADLGESGTTSDREYINYLIEAAKEDKFDCLFIVNHNRLGRNADHTANIRAALKDEYKQVYSLAQPLPLKCPDCYDPLDDDTAAVNEKMHDIFSQIDLGNIRRNYKKGMPIRINDGKPAGCLCYGLVRRYKKLGVDPQGNEKYEEYWTWDNNRSLIVIRIGQMYLGGLGEWKIAQILNDEGIASPKGKRWGRSAIKCILTNPAYAGWVRWQWKVKKKKKRVIQPREKWMLCPATYPSLWENGLEYYNKLQDERQRRRKFGGRALGSSALLIGLLHCALCKGPMFQTSDSNKHYKNGTKSCYRGYGCGNYMHGKGCKLNSKSQEVVDNSVLIEILKLANDSTYQTYRKKMISLSRKNKRNLLTQKKMALTDNINRLARIKHAFENGIDSEEEYQTRKDELVPVITELENSITSIKKQLDEDKGIVWEKHYKQTLQDFLNNDNEARQKTKVILRNLIDKIELQNRPLKIQIFYRLDS